MTFENEHQMMTAIHGRADEGEDVRVYRSGL